MRKVMLICFVLALVVLANMSVFTVDPTEYVYVTQFGRHVATYDGGKTDTDAGLHFRWPWPVQTVLRVDRRLQSFDLPATELLTRDPGIKVAGKSQVGTIDKTLTVEAYVCWRVADQDAVDRFIRRIETSERARAILGQRVNSELGALIGQMRMDDLISKDLVDVPLDPHNPQAGTTSVTKVERNMEELRKKLMARLEKAVLEEYGIQIVDIRLRRFNHPAEVRPAIFARIEAERNRQANFYRTEGKQRAKEIVSEAQAAATELRGKAKADAELKEDQARTEAAGVRARAYREDFKFFVFQEQMKKMTSVLGENRTVLLLSTHHPIFSFMFRPPEPGVPGGGNPGMQPSIRRPGEHRRIVAAGRGE
jgi:membrane protease subunit HflC